MALLPGVAGHPPGKEEIALINRRLASVCCGFAAAVTVAGLTAGSAAADTSAPTATQYPVSGTTHIHRANADLTLGPGTLATLYQQGNGSFYGGRLTLPSATLSFTEGGNAVSATIGFNESTTMTGTVSGSGAVTVSTQQALSVSSLTVAGQSVSVGTSCQTVKPVTITARSASGFSLTDGGTMTASYAISPFGNCGVQGDQVLNGALPGPFNSASLTLGPAQNLTIAPGNDDILPVFYPFNGTTHIHRGNSDVTLGPGTLYAMASLHDGGVYGGDLSLPPGSGSTTLHGQAVSVTTAFNQVGPISGTLSLSSGAVTSTANEILQVTNLTVGGKNIPVPASCQTVRPVVIHAATTSGFNVLEGGTLAAPSYYIPPFVGCGQATNIVNQVLPGPGNSLDLTLGAATVFP